ncbi:hypothetical protein E4U41_007331 [Claviceps citrina]|nr:hypothetical protein E4U41_007331 [Claviceps citrina]
MWAASRPPKGLTLPRVVLKGLVQRRLLVESLPYRQRQGDRSCQDSMTSMAGRLPVVAAELAPGSPVTCGALGSPQKVPTGQARLLQSSQALLRHPLRSLGSCDVPKVASEVLNGCPWEMVLMTVAETQELVSASEPCALGRRAAACLVAAGRRRSEEQQKAEDVVKEHARTTERLAPRVSCTEVPGRASDLDQRDLGVLAKLQDRSVGRQGGEAKVERPRWRGQWEAANGKRRRRRTAG